jgi:hypothetical protein
MIEKGLQKCLTLFSITKEIKNLVWASCGDLLFICIVISNNNNILFFIAAIS